jgi:hypothetical protein
MQLTLLESNNREKIAKIVKLHSGQDILGMYPYQGLMNTSHCFFGLQKHFSDKWSDANDWKHRNSAIQGKSMLALVCTPPSHETSLNTALGLGSCICNRKVSNPHLEQGILHGSVWSSCICLFTMIWVPQGLRQCSESFFQYTWAIWTILSQK